MPDFLFITIQVIIHPIVIATITAIRTPRNTSYTVVLQPTLSVMRSELVPVEINQSIIFKQWNAITHSAGW